MSKDTETNRKPLQKEGRGSRFSTLKKQEYVTSVRMPLDLRDQLVAIAKREQRSLNNLMVNILSEAVYNDR